MSLVFCFGFNTKLILFSRKLESRAQMLKNVTSLIIPPPRQTTTITLEHLSKLSTQMDI